MVSSDAGVLRQWYHWGHSVADKSMSESMVLPQLASILMPTNNGATKDHLEASHNLDQNLWPCSCPWALLPPGLCKTECPLMPNWVTVLSCPGLLLRAFCMSVALL